MYKMPLIGLQFEFFRFSCIMSYQYYVYHICTEGTFKTVPHLFHQLYMLHCLHTNNGISLVFSLLPNKKKEITCKHFTLENLQSISTSYNRGCFSHFSQSIFRQIQADGLKNRYEKMTILLYSFGYHRD